MIELRSGIPVKVGMFLDDGCIAYCVTQISDYEVWGYCIGSKDYCGEWEYALDPEIELLDVQMCDLHDEENVGDFIQYARNSINALKEIRSVLHTKQESPTRRTMRGPLYTYKEICYNNSCKVNAGEKAFCTYPFHAFRLGALAIFVHLVILSDKGEATRQKLLNALKRAYECADKDSLYLRISIEKLDDLLLSLLSAKKIKVEQNGKKTIYRVDKNALNALNIHFRENGHNTI
jgi:hypothetical protein